MNRILLVDDDEDDRFFFQDALQSINPTVICDTAINGKVALDALKRTTSLPDLIFLDLNMPIMNGFDFLKSMKTENALNKIPIGIFSTSKFIRDIELAKNLGANFFFTKPNSPEILIKKLQEILSSDFSTDNYIIV